MATKKTTTKKTAAKKAGPKKAARKTVKKTAGTGKTVAKPSRRQFTEKQMRAMLNMMLNKYADQVKGGNVNLTTAEGFKLMQLQESLGLLRPSSVKVEWVEPKEG